MGLIKNKKVSIETISKINEENLALVLAEEGERVKIVHSLKSELIPQIQEFITSSEHDSNREEGYLALACIGKHTGIDSSSFIIENVLNEKNPELIGNTLSRLKGWQTPIVGQVEKLAPLLKSRKKDIREGAISALAVCQSEQVQAEEALISLLEETKNDDALFWISQSLEVIGTSKCLPTLIRRYKETRSLDTVAVMAMAIAQIDPIGQTDFFIDLLENRNETVVHRVAMNCLAKSLDSKALPAVKFKVEKNLRKKPTSPDIDYQGEIPEMVSAITYLMHYKADPDISTLLDTIKNKKSDFLDFPTLKWVKNNL
ncbi:MAG: hypothetical protein ACI837_002023 [Crocinitomicaceae bacterium]|jgi:hypothetical protein